MEDKTEALKHKIHWATTLACDEEEIIEELFSIVSKYYRENKRYAYSVCLDGYDDDDVIFIMSPKKDFNKCLKNMKKSSHQLIEEFKED